MFTSEFLFVKGKDFMVKCPNCGKEVSNPDKSFKNRVFHVEAYTCKNCSNYFKVSK
jgi:formate dehydrogenase maturation protein FdhE